LRCPNDNASDFLLRILPFVESDGARNLNQISKELGIPYQTLRFRMIRLKDKGISVLAIPDIEKLGLEKVRVFFRLGFSIGDPKGFFRGLHETSGLRSYSRTLDSQIFDCEFAIPEGTFEELLKLLQNLETMKVLVRPQLRKLVWKQVSMLKTEFYDYSRGEWDVDFASLSGNPCSVESPTKSKRDNIDYSDLLMIKEIEQDPWVKIVELANKSRLTAGDAAYHFNRHVFGKRLIQSFKLTWAGTKQAWLKHSIISKTYVFKGVFEEGARHVMSIFSSIPFVWSHMMMEGGTYMVETILPISQYTETTQYVSSQLRSLGISPSHTFEKDWSCLSSFTIPYMLFNRNKGSWEFKADQALENIPQLVRAYPNL
jgi:DNA-binding Lrp family transcriptional regulator